MEYDIKCGIYKITNKITHDIYVGQSTNIYKRWYSHKQAMKTYTHSNKKLLYDYFKYGLDSFEFEIIEECKEKDLFDYERYWIKKISTYNKDTFKFNPKDKEFEKAIIENDPTRIYSDKKRKKMTKLFSSRFSR